MTRQASVTADARAARIRAVNVRTGRILLAIATLFFAGIIVAQYSGRNGVGLSVLGLAAIGFLLVAIGRNIRQ